MSSLAFKVYGKGSPVILIHGFPFNKEIWNNYAEVLAKDFKVYTLDLPGFGDSNPLSSGFSLRDVARSVIGWMNSQGIEKPVIIGHSLGGYVVLAMAEENPSLFSGLVLFHSTAKADTEEKKENRNKVIEFIDKNGVKTFTANFITPLFYDKNSPAIETVKEIAIKAEEMAVKGYTLAMRDREDRTSVLKNFHKPVLIIGGEYDAGISVESLKEQASLNPGIHLSVLKGTAHMGMLEAPSNTIQLLREHILKCNPL